MDCPVCRKPMVVLEFNDVEMDFCTACKGCWLDKGELGLILHRKLDLPEDWQIEGKDRTERRCPRCNEQMRSALLPGTKVEIDACPKNDGLWFDSGELQAVARAKGTPGAASALADFCACVFGHKTGGIR